MASRETWSAVAHYEARGNHNEYETTIDRQCSGAVVALYILGFLIWQMVFTDFFAAKRGVCRRRRSRITILWAVALVNTVLCCFYSRWPLNPKGGVKSLATGLKVGAVVGFLLWGTTDFILFGYQNINKSDWCDLPTQSLKGSGAVYVAP